MSSSCIFTGSSFRHLSQLSLWNGACHLHPETDDACLRTKDIVKQTLQQIGTKFFPPQYEENVPRVVGCSHILQICPGKSLNGTQLAPTERSCSTCSTVWSTFLKIVQTPIQKLNENAASFFCKKQDDICKQSFSVVISLMGPLNDIFKDPSLINEVCETKMECVK
ncbi:hypothetical protein GCK72_024121 [Caenorhabditis remanei]|uniref:Uncharacterized protein n=1 Tax=Caenorhabditis remanei TaxID=31234 RepID=A0A6A5FYV6_CAERE|nr:hypothetical protein GCK72_024121 [Caenorhabditis remanei]KAF1747655.1 hypothetical protein GCK72_024121 [Caenorhabditis remanei]